MAQNAKSPGLWDTIKSNVQNFEKMVGGKSDQPAPKKDYLAHNWSPPKGRTAPKQSLPRPQAKATGKRGGK